MKRQRNKKLFIVFLACVLLSGCGIDKGVNIDFLKGGSRQTEETESIDTGFRAMGPGEYDSKDTAVIVSVNEEEDKITFLNRIVNKNYTLTYDGTTVITDQYGEAMSAAQLAPGDIVDVNFQHVPKKCVSVTISPSSWEADVTTGFTMNQARGQISFNGDLYTLAERMILRSGDEEIELMDLNERDVLSVKGIENTVYSILVEKGHGYLRLTGSEYFIDGFIEIGQEMVQRVTEDMLLTVPEGQYTVVIRNGRHGGSKATEIYRDEETVLDVSDLKGEEIKTGNVFFTLTPADASVYIDGEKVDTSAYVTLEYGIHQMIVKASGYETISQYLKVGQENANLNVEMEPEGTSGEDSEETDEPEDEDNPYAAYEALPLEGEPGSGIASDNGEAEDEPEDEREDEAEGNNGENGTPPAQTTPKGEVTTGSGTWHVKVNAPKDAEVYVDGNYVGLAPVSFPKNAGTHVISLRKNGYQTRSYTIQVDSEEKDMELSFSELVKKTDTGLGNTALNGLGTSSLNGIAAGSGLGSGLGTGLGTGLNTGLGTNGLGDEEWTDDILSQILSKS